MKEVRELINTEKKLKQFLTLSSTFIEFDSTNILKLLDANVDGNIISYRRYDEWNRIGLSVTKGESGIKLDIPYFTNEGIVRKPVSYFSDQQLNGFKKNNVIDALKSNKVFFHENLDSEMAKSLIEIINENNYNFKIEVGVNSIFSDNTPFILKSKEDFPIYYLNPNSKGETVIRALLHLIIIYSINIDRDITPKYILSNGYVMIQNHDMANIFMAILFVLNKALYFNHENKLEFDTLFNQIKNNNEVENFLLLNNIVNISQSLYFKLLYHFKIYNYNTQREIKNNLEKEDIEI